MEQMEPYLDSAFDALVMALGTLLSLRIRNRYLAIAEDI